MTDHDIDLTITKIETREPNIGGAWVSGTINNEYRFQALVFADHAECEEYELGKSKISKLWIQRTEIARRSSISIAAWMCRQPIPRFR